MIYQAILTHSGERMTIPLGNCADTVAACAQASLRCPKGWEVFDVHPSDVSPHAEAIRAHLRAIGSKGGKTTGPTKARSRAAMQAAGRKRWANYTKPS